MGILEGVLPSSGSRCGIPPVAHSSNLQVAPLCGLSSPPDSPLPVILASQSNCLHSGPCLRLCVRWGWSPTKTFRSSLAPRANGTEFLLLIQLSVITCRKALWHRAAFPSSSQASSPHSCKPPPQGDSLAKAPLAWPAAQPHGSPGEWRQLSCQSQAHRE